jgi:hypothetical protein
LKQIGEDAALVTIINGVVQRLLPQFLVGLHLLLGDWVQIQPQYDAVYDDD